MDRRCASALRHSVFIAHFPCCRCVVLTAVDPLFAFVVPLAFPPPLPLSRGSLMGVGIDLTDQQNDQLWQLRLHWSVSVALLSISACLMIPIYTRFLRSWREHHVIVQASVSLLVPDLLLVVNFLPLEVMNLSVDHFASRNYCTASAFLTVSSILASNAGVIFVAFTTWNVIAHGQKQTNWRWLLGSQAVGWALGVALAAYYYTKDYLGVYLGLYCCTTDKHHLDIVLPVFITFFVSSSAMAWFYFATFKHIRNVTQLASNLKSKSPNANERTLHTVAVKPITTRPPSLGGANGGAVEVHSATPSRRGSLQLEAVEHVAGSPAPVPRAIDGAVAPVTAPSPSDLPAPPHSGVVRAWSVQASTRQLVNETAAGNAGRSSGAATPLHRSATPSVAMAAASPPTPTRGPLLAQGSVAQLAGADSQSPAVRRAAMSESKSRDLAFRMLLRGLGLISVYYLCWFFVSLNAALSLGGYRFETLWAEMVAAWFIKLSPIADALILWDLMRRAESNRNAAKAIGGVQPTRFESTVAPLPERNNRRATGGGFRQPSPVLGRPNDAQMAVAAAGGHQRRASGSGTVTPPHRGSGVLGLHAPAHSIDAPRSRGSLRHSLTGASIELQPQPHPAVTIVNHARGGSLAGSGSGELGNEAAARLRVDAVESDETAVAHAHDDAAAAVSAAAPLAVSSALSPTSSSAIAQRVSLHPVILPPHETRNTYLPAPSPVVEETLRTPTDATPH